MTDELVLIVMLGRWMFSLIYTTNLLHIWVHILTHWRFESMATVVIKAGA